MKTLVTPVEEREAQKKMAQEATKKSLAQPSETGEEAKEEAEKEEEKEKPSD